MAVRLCNAHYLSRDHGRLYCTFRSGHLAGPEPSKHSWQWVANAETVDEDALPDDVQAVLDAIARGNCDPYLEVILATAHTRKRTMRGVPGFRRPV